MQDGEEETHRKRMAQILRYIASMHTTLYDHDNLGFCQDVAHRRHPERELDFFANSPEVLFTTDSFRHLLMLQQDRAVFEAPPFTFYAAAAETRQKNKRSLQALFQGGPEKTCWLRITRLTSSQIAKRPVVTDKVKPYLQSWAESQKISVNELLQSLPILESGPKLPPGARHATQIHQFLRRVKKHLRQKAFLDLVEPIYNRLFEWQQQQQEHHSELVWGLGHARMLHTNPDDGSTTLVNGPLLEVLVEVDLARDGALVLRPRDHTGVTLNRNVVAGLFADAGNNNNNTVSQLYKDVAELEPALLSPAQPMTYAKLLKRMAVELSPGGVYQNSGSSTSNNQDPRRLVVTEAWCVYQRSKPSSVWARDATAFADQLSLQNTNLYASPKATLPLASWAFTHGPSTLDKIVELEQNPRNSMWGRIQDWVGGSPKNSDNFERPLFPLPTSEAQNKIVNLLLQGHPAVVCEGPPGTGKSHSIANLICAYLCSGKRVLCTSKQAPALSVLRNRLPPSVQELCVDVSRSELAGLQQLQITVERLANRVACASAQLETEKCEFLTKTIAQHTQELTEIDAKLTKQSDKIRKLVNQAPGQELVQRSLELIEEAPWLASTMANWSLKQVKAVHDRIGTLVVEPGDRIRQVTGFTIPPSDALISRVAAEAGNVFSVAKNAIRSTAAGVPFLGSVTGIERRQQEIDTALGMLRFKGCVPCDSLEWKIVLQALQHSKALYTFEMEIWRVHVGRSSWPKHTFASAIDELTVVHGNFCKAVLLKNLASKLKVEAEIQNAMECQALDARRGMITTRLQGLAEELVDANVLTELSRSFSTEAQSALIRFAQIAGKAKFSRSSQPSKMSQRQRRRRKEYLDAFDKCCRFIPCWILTTSQISDYLPSECLFDLVILDEASQSDITALPGMLRGKQWLIVGDGKQVSPTESFVSEEHINTLRAALPTSPLEDSLLPGQSFFDLCAQAFPKGRVVLSEHFRCAEEIIKFSNDQFYDGRLVPLRLPTKSERLTPSLVDVRVAEGAKVGKTNEAEADEIVRLIKEFTSGETQATAPRSIGVISLMGDEQSRLIRGRLLDSIGPQLMARHNVLVGDPPSFQGAERDIIYLSMVCSRGSVPTQSQLMHVQRANVAMSRARDRCVLVRSIDIHDIPNDTDVKIPIIEFFTSQDDTEELRETREKVGQGGDTKQCIRDLLSGLIKDRGYAVRDMGVVWEGGLSIEHGDSDKRAAVFVDCAGESHQEWQASYKQQKAIERVGWHCIRVDALTMLSNHQAALRKIVQFLVNVGIEEPEPEPLQFDDSEEEDFEHEPMHDDNNDDGGNNDEAPSEPENNSDTNQDNNDDGDNDNDDINNDGNRDNDDIEGEDRAPDRNAIVISSDDDSDSEVKPKKKKARAQPDVVVSEQVEMETAVDPSNFGQVVDLSFLGGSASLQVARRGGKQQELNGSSDSDQFQKPQVHKARAGKVERRQRRRGNERDDEESHNTSSEDDDYQGDASDMGESNRDSRTYNKRRRHRKRKMDKYSRDGRWYPGPNKEPLNAEDDHNKWYDTDDSNGNTVSKQKKEDSQKEGDDDDYVDRQENDDEYKDDDFEDE